MGWDTPSATRTLRVINAPGAHANRSHVSPQSSMTLQRLLMLEGWITRTIVILGTTRAALALRR